MNLATATPLHLPTTDGLVVAIFYWSDGERLDFEVRTQQSGSTGKPLIHFTISGDDVITALSNALRGDQT